MSGILVIAEHDGRRLNQSTARTLSCARAIGGDVAVLVLGQGCDSIAAEAAALEGVARVLVVDDADCAHPVAARLAPRIVSLAGDFEVLLGPATTFGKDLMPRVAALLGVPQVSDIMAVTGPRTFKRPIYAGNAIVTVEVPAGQAIVGTVRGASFRPVGAGGSAPVEKVAAQANVPAHTRFVELRSGASDRPDLQTARIVVSGGRGVGSAENFAILNRLADRLGAAVGASRAAVDAGFVPNDLQVGQTGKIIAPELYLAFGISGAIQHLTGIKDAGVIVAVNKDGDAPIFEVADIGLVGDLFHVIPEIEKRLG
jgi:electron transfer flavoprotein alpha subunit